MYIGIFRRLRDAVRTKYPQNWRTNSWFLLHYNAAAHRSVLVKDFLAQNNVTTLDHPPYAPDLATPDFHLIPRLKSALNGRHSFAATDVIKNTTEELKSLSRKGFQECLRHIYSRWQKFIISQGNSLKEIWLKWLYCFVFFRTKVIPGTF